MMISRALMAMICMMLAGGVQAKDADVISVSELRELAYVGDVATVSRALKDAQRGYLAGEVAADEMRALFASFQTTDPRMIAFVDQWLAAEPEGAMPNAARSWNLIKAANLMIGAEFTNAVHEDAVHAYRILLKKAEKTTRLAYERDPDLIPASDAVISLINRTSVMRNPTDVADHVMKSRPNWGTLSRLQFLASPGYRGTKEMMDRICETYGPMVPSDGYDIVFRCKFIGYRLYYPGEFEWHVENLDVSDDPLLDRYRAKVIVQMAYDGRATDKQMRFARRDLSKPTMINHHMAMRYNSFIAIPNGWPHIDRQVILQAREYAKRELEHDPFDHELIDMVLMDFVPEKGVIGRKSTHFPLPDATDDAMRTEYARRKLISRPHDPHLWSEYAGQLTQRRTPEAFFLGEPFRENAVYYSNQSPGYLISIVFRKAQEYQSVEEASTMTLPPQWAQFFKTLDVENRIECPFLRAYRLLQDVCKKTDAPQCFNPPQFQEPIDEVAKQIADKKSCEAVASAPISELYYTPHALPLASVPEAN